MTNQLKCVATVLVLGALMGCGGGGAGSQAPGTLSGVVLDLNGNPVRGASVSADGHTTNSSSNGSFTLTGISTGDILISATSTQNSITFTGKTFAKVFTREQTSSAVITVSRQDKQGALKGTIFDVFGNGIGGAKVFASVNGQAAQVAYTDKVGDFFLENIAANTTYVLTATAQGFKQDVVSISVNVGETRTRDLHLPDSTGTGLLAPSGVTAVAWTSPGDITRSATQSQAYESIKRQFDPLRSRKAISRDTINGNPVEVDLTWNPLTSTSLQGFGIYRASGTTGTPTDLALNPDPTSTFYADQDRTLIEDATYRYQVSSLDVDYPNSGSPARSSIVSVSTLGDLFLLSPLVSSSVTFRWNAVSGAQQYTAFLYDQYPGVGVDPVWPSGSQPYTSSTSLNCNYGSFQVGHTYYYVVLGLANSNSSRTISQIQSFTY